jgi:hypothetical protein
MTDEEKLVWKEGVQQKISERELRRFRHVK